MNKQGKINISIIIIGLTILIALLPFSFAPIDTKSYNKATETITLKDTATLKLISNTYTCGTTCSAIIKINPSVNLGTAVNIKSSADYKWEFLGSGLNSWKLYRIDNYGQKETYKRVCEMINNKTLGKDVEVCYYVRNGDGQNQVEITTLDLSKEQYIKLVGYKDRFANIEWIPTFAGQRLTEWANWDGSIYINSPLNQTYTTPTITINISTGGGTDDLNSIWFSNDTGNTTYYLSGSTLTQNFPLNYTSLIKPSPNNNSIYGIQIKTNGNAITLLSIAKNHSDNCTMGVLMAIDNVTILANASFIGDVATFPTPYVLNATTFYWLGGYGGANRSRVGSLTYPYAGTLFNWTGGWNTDYVADEGFTINSATFLNGSGSSGTGVTTQTYSAGSHTLKSYANTTTGTTNSTSVMFFISNTAPTLTINYPDGNYILPANTIANLNYTAIGSPNSCWWSANNGIKNTTITSCANISINLEGNYTLGSSVVYLWANNSLNNVTYATKSFSILPTFSICNSTITQQVLNINFYDESNSSAVPATLTTGTSFTYWYDNQNNNKTYAFTNSTENLNYTFCVYPNYGNVSADYKLYYTSTGYQPRIYSQTDASLTNATTNKNLPLLLTGNGIYARIKVIDEYFNGVVGATVTQSYGGVLIDTQISDSGGGITFFVDPDLTYDYVASKTGYTSNSASLRITSTDIVNIGITSSGGTGYTPSAGFKYWFSPSGILENNTNYNFMFVVNSSSFYVNSCNIVLKNSTTVLGTNTTNSADGIGCVAQYYFNTGNQEIINSIGIINSNVSSTNYTKQYPVENTEIGSGSLYYLISDLKAFSDAGFNDFSRAFIGLLLVIGLVLTISNIGGTREPDMVIWLIIGATFFVSYIGFFTIGSPASGLFRTGLNSTVNGVVTQSVTITQLKQYIIFYLTALFGVGWQIWRRT